MPRHVVSGSETTLVWNPDSGNVSNDTTHVYVAMHQGPINQWQCKALPPQSSVGQRGPQSGSEALSRAARPSVGQRGPQSGSEALSRSAGPSVESWGPQYVMALSRYLGFQLCRQSVCRALFMAGTSLLGPGMGSLKSGMLNSGLSWTLSA